MEKVYSELKWQEKNVSLLHFVPWGLDVPCCGMRSLRPGQEALRGVSLWRPLCLLQTLEEIAELQQDIRHLEEDLRRKFLNLKLCHTRLESRTYRPNVELCRDQVRGYPSGPLPSAKIASRSLTLHPAHLSGGEEVLKEG